MKNTVLWALAALIAASAGCAGLSSVNYSRFDRGRRITRLAVVANNQTTADRYKMWAWTKRKPRIVPEDTFAEQIGASLASRTNLPIVPQAAVNEALEKLNLKGKVALTRHDLREIGELTGADAILQAEVSFYLQNYLFWKTLGVVEITMKIKGLPDVNLLWKAKGRNVALFMTTDTALDKVRDTMLTQAAQKLAGDAAMGR
ncbi:MAG: hypothetical protein WCP22_10580 [Chlamydiota bacterium]